MTLGIILLLLGAFLIGGVFSMAGQARDAGRSAGATDPARRARYGAPSTRGPLVAAVVLGVCAVLALAGGALRIIG